MTADRPMESAANHLQMLKETDCCPSPNTPDVEQAVRDRYGAAATDVEPELCCPVDYGDLDLSHVPREVMERDYGCGNPAPFVRVGDTVLDLGSGPGKMCYAVAKLVGSGGRVIGVDCNSEMLSLARGYRDQVAASLGYSIVEFRCGMIQDLRLDLEAVTDRWCDGRLSTASDWLEMRDLESDLRANSPLIADRSVDCVISNCVLNLVRKEDRHQLFAEVFRVLRPGGRAAISDIVSSQDVPDHLQHDPMLWSGCISGAFRETEFVDAFRRAGFAGIEIARLEQTPWKIVEGIEFRSMTLVAYKPTPGIGAQGDNVRQSVIYRGPFAQVVDDRGMTYRRGERIDVDQFVYGELTRAPYQRHFIGGNQVDTDDSCCSDGDSCC